MIKLHTDSSQIAQLLKSYMWNVFRMKWNNPYDRFFYWLVQCIEIWLSRLWCISPCCGYWHITFKWIVITIVYLEIKTSFILKITAIWYNRLPLTLYPFYFILFVQSFVFIGIVFLVWNVSLKRHLLINDISTFWQ